VNRDDLNAPPHAKKHAHLLSVLAVLTVAHAAEPIQPPGPEQSRSVGQVPVSASPALPAVIGGDGDGWVGGEIPPFIPPAKPLVEVAMRDPSICRGPDNTYDLVGTTGKDMWHRNDGIEMWKSRDLKDWEYVGLVWTFAKDAKADWQKGKLNPDGTRTPKPLWAPELHYIQGQWYLAACVERLGCVLLKSTSGRPEGPYTDLKPDASMAPGPLYDASLFEDDDGQVYFLCSPGVRVARMKPDLSDLAEPLRPVTVAPGTKWHNCEGPYMAKLNGRYYLFMAQGTRHQPEGGRAGPGVNSSYDIWAMSAPTPYGPFEKRHLAFPRAGHNVVFQDHTGRWWSTWGTNVMKDALDLPFSRNRPSSRSKWTARANCGKPRLQKIPFRTPEILRPKHPSRKPSTTRRGTADRRVSLR
jgi:beta-xylosidase